MSDYALDRMIKHRKKLYRYELSNKKSGSTDEVHEELTDQLLTVVDEAFEQSDGGFFNNISSISDLRKHVNDLYPLATRKRWAEQLHVSTASVQRWEGRDLGALAMTDRFTRVICTGGITGDGGWEATNSLHNRGDIVVVHSNYKYSVHGGVRRTLVLNRDLWGFVDVRSLPIPSSVNDVVVVGGGTFNKILSRGDSFYDGGGVTFSMSTDITEVVDVRTNETQISRSGWLPTVHRYALPPEDGSGMPSLIAKGAYNQHPLYHLTNNTYGHAGFKSFSPSHFTMSAENNTIALAQAHDGVRDIDEVSTDTAEGDTSVGTTAPNKGDTVLGECDMKLLDHLDKAADLIGMSGKPSKMIRESSMYASALMDASKDNEKLTAEVKKIREELATRGGEFKVEIIHDSSSIEATKDWPELEEMGTDTVLNLFGKVNGATDKLLNMEVPVFVWAEEHPMVPTVDEHYIFDPDKLAVILYSLISGDLTYLVGHTGTGKTTTVEQVCARMGWPFYRISFMDEVGRMELVGRETLTVDEDKGVGVSRFEPGPLAQFYGKPVVILLDEYDSVTPGASYIFQPLFEGKPLEVMEDGGRMIKPDPMMRMMGSGNTTGGGDETGMYNATRPQSAAQVNRWSYYVEFDYMTPMREWDLLTKRVPEVEDYEKDLLKPLATYIEKHRKAFTQGECSLPLSPRNITAIGRLYCLNRTLGEKHTNALHKAMSNVVFQRCNSSDRAVLSGVLDAIQK